MTDQELLDLYHQRMAALDATKDPSGLELRRHPPARRATFDEASRLFRARDKAITAELLNRGSPAELPGVTLWLTQDGLNWIALCPGTRIPLVWESHRSEHEGLENAKCMLYRYGKGA